MTTLTVPIAEQDLTSLFPSTTRDIAGVASHAPARSRSVDHSDDSVIDLTLLTERPKDMPDRRGLTGRLNELDVEAAITRSDYLTYIAGAPSDCKCGCGRPGTTFYDGMAKYCVDLAWAKQQRRLKRSQGDE